MNKVLFYCMEETEFIFLPFLVVINIINKIELE